MQFNTKEDIEAPVDFVFEQISDFDGFERSAMRRGIDIRCTEPGGENGLGRAWTGKADFRGKARNFSATVMRSDPPQILRLEGQSDGFDIALELELVALSPRRTRMRATLDLTPRNLSARLILQSARLAKQALTKRYKQRVHVYAQDLNGRLAGRATG